MDHTRRILADRMLLVSGFLGACALASLVIAAHDTAIRSILAVSSLWWVLQLVAIVLMVLVPVSVVVGIGDVFFTPVHSSEPQEMAEAPYQQTGGSE